jgi:general stress protein CsbA
MKKPIEKRKIEMTWTKDGFINMGYNKAFCKSRWYMLPLFIVLAVVSVFVGKMDYTAGLLILIVDIIALILWYLAMYMEGKKFWKDNKDKPEPIHIKRFNYFGKDIED